MDAGLGGVKVFLEFYHKVRVLESSLFLFLIVKVLLRFDDDCWHDMGVIGIGLLIILIHPISLLFQLIALLLYLFILVVCVSGARGGVSSVLPWCLAERIFLFCFFTGILAGV